MNYGRSCKKSGGANSKTSVVRSARPLRRQRCERGSIQHGRRLAGNYAARKACAVKLIGG